MKKYLFILIIICLFILPGITFAVTIESMATSIMRTAWIIATAVVVVMWIATGVLFLTALGDVGKLSTAKKSLFAAIAGTIIVIIANSAIGLISNAIGA